MLLQQNENLRLRVRVSELEAELARLRGSTGNPANPGKEDRSLVTMIGRLMEDAPVGFAFYNADFRYELVNSKLVEKHGVPASQHIGRTVEEIVPQLAGQARQAFQSVLGTGKPLVDVEFSGEMPREPGIQRRWSESWYPVHAPDGRLLGVAAVVTEVTEVTEHKRAVEALRLNQERLELAQAAAGIGSWEWDFETNEVRCSPEYGPLYGLPPSTAGPSYDKFLELVHPDDRERLQEEVRRVLGGVDEYRSEFRVVWPDGTIHWLIGRGRVSRDSQGKATRIHGVNMDITERKQAEQALRDSEQRFRSMADGAPVMICACGGDRQATFFNKGWLSFTGRTMEQELGVGWAEGVHPEDRNRVLAEIAAAFDVRGYCHAEYRLRRADGEYRWILCNGAPRIEPDGTFAGYVASVIDITNLKRSREEAIARQKLESVGVLASGIAHDFNNLLGSILADSELLELEIPADSPAREGISRIKLVAARAAEIVSELLSYAGHEDAVFEPVDVPSLVDEMLQLLKVSISKRATLKVDLPADLPAVRANPSQIRQVILNLVTNAAESLGGQGGVITVAASHARKSRDSFAAEATLPNDDYIRLEIRDTGCGMTREIVDRVFDPYFTTKLAGRGLGLAVVQGIIRRHGGEIHVVSTPGQGTCIAVLLPSTGKPVPEAGSTPESRSDADEGSTTGTVLLVEDEVALRVPISKMLRKKGYSVFEAADGAAAVDLFRSKAQEIDVVLLDMTLPGKSGPEVFSELIRIQPHVKVILTTAYSEERARTALGEQEDWAFLQKPYQIGDLVRLLQRARSGKDTTETDSRVKSAGASG